ncbi:protein draper-like [Lingula anatina]|uniref:Protein draper-like n=1 Tax=Lingula anatina TaxID=7574 RepID=A0A1S3IZU6_LINAN|nr:protein draper-like [Lingula anatina]|eukprot:XP_013403069.1 protein draper-like [Lingula anatina]
MESLQALAWILLLGLVGQRGPVFSGALAGPEHLTGANTSPKSARNGPMFDVTVLNSEMTSFSIRWTTISGNNTVEIYVIHVGDSKGEIKAINVTNSSSTTSVIRDLERGTRYWVYVQAVFSSTPAVNSTVQTTMTKGYGPDRSCNCDKAGTETPSHEPLCNTTTGVCVCKMGYEGNQCHKCASGYVRPKNESYCSYCPCKGKCIISAEHDWLCECEEGYAGPYCDQCNFGYYKDQEQGPCLPCQDSATVCSSPSSGAGLDGPTKGLIAGCSVAALLILLAVGGYFGYRRYKHWKVRRPGQFWTIEVRDNDEDSASMLENDYHNMIDANAMMEDLEHFDSNSSGVKTPSQSGANGEIRVAYNHNYRDKVT